MLKWTVTRPPNSSDSCRTDFQNCSSRRIYRKTKRKNRLLNKENIYTSTPHRLTKKEGLLPLQNISNISFYENFNFINEATTSPDNQQRNKNGRYFSTLPTFDAEYSPCYFEEKSILHTSFKGSTEKRPLALTESFQYETSEESIHPSKVGDITLEQIIDDILKSTKKYPKKPKYTSSPSYQKCSDPANDLRFHKGKLIMSPKDFIKAVEKTLILDSEVNVNEREIKTPNCYTPMLPGNLRRQRALKRKCKIKTTLQDL